MDDCAAGSSFWEDSAGLRGAIVELVLGSEVPSIEKNSGYLECTTVTLGMSRRRRHGRILPKIIPAGFNISYFLFPVKFLSN